MADLKKIQDCIDQITPLIEEVEALQPVTKGRFGGTPVEPTYLADDINDLKEKIDTWHAVTAQILVNEVGDSNPQLFDFSSRWRAPIRAYDYKTSLKRKLERARSDLRILLAVVKEKGEDTPAAAVKPPKVFISHKTEDSAYAEALKNLINFIIGAEGDKLFCSSIPGYGIKPSQDIIDNIKAQFSNYNLFVIIIHSPRYYKSAVCLNEMGAAWALNTKFCSFLTKDCRIDQLTGVIGKEEIWDMAYPWLASPVQEVLYCDSMEQIPQTLRFVTYDKALAEYTFMADFSGEAFAVFKNDDTIKRLKSSGTFNPVEGKYRVKLWKYNPA